MQWMIEQAKEEVEMLEYQHPNKFKCLKHDLRVFISELESQKQGTISIYADTEESSSNKIEKVGSTKRRRMCTTDAVLERAQHCLHKIQHLKASLSSTLPQLLLHKNQNLV